VRDGGDLLVERACVRNSQMTPDLRRLGIEGKDTFGKRFDNGREPGFEAMRLIRVATAPDAFGATTQLTAFFDSVGASAEPVFLSSISVDDAAIRLFPLSAPRSRRRCQSNTCGERSAGSTRSKSVSRPTSGIDARTSAKVRRRGRASAAFTIARCSASALRPCAPARSFSARTISSSTPRTRGEA
jgi:hypothetical protein